MWQYPHSYSTRVEPNSVQLVSASSTYSVSLDEAKLFMRLSTATTTEDNLIIAMIRAAESYAENYTRSAICRQQWQIRMDSFAGSEGEIRLPRPPLSTASSDVVVSYVTTDGSSTTLTSSAYTIDYYSKPAVIYPSYDNTWPEPRTQRNAVTVQYFCGYSTPGNVPDAIKSWIKCRVAAMYENRESIMVGTGNFISELPHNYVDGLLDEFIVE